MNHTLPSLCLIGFAGAAFAEGDGKETASSPVSRARPAPVSDKLTGDWFGARTTIAEHGIGIEIQPTRFYQGLISGIKPARVREVPRKA
jgi:hypothetical protein